MALPELPVCAMRCQKQVNWCVTTRNTGTAKAWQRSIRPLNMHKATHIAVYTLRHRHTTANSDCVASFTYDLLFSLIPHPRIPADSRTSDALVDICTNAALMMCRVSWGV